MEWEEQNPWGTNTKWEKVKMTQKSEVSGKEDVAIHAETYKFGGLPVYIGL